MKKIIPIIGLAGAIASGATAAQPQKMNVLFIAVDDLKPTTGAYGDRLAITPAMDKLAAQGIVMQNIYCQQAVSGPTRASIMTGMRPDKTRVWDLFTDFRQVNPSSVTIPQYFKQQGYKTAALGKIYHMGSVGAGHDSMSWNVPYINQRAPMFFLPTEINSKGKGKSSECVDVPDVTYGDGQIAAMACESLQELSKNTQPFFLAIGFIRPHLPFVAPKKYWDMHDRGKFSIAPWQKPSAGGPQVAYHPSVELAGYTDIPPFDSYSDADSLHLSAEKQLELIHGYYAATSYTDAQIGKVIDQLDRLGLRENTIIVLWGDHGWHLGDHGLWNKQSNFEQATRALCILSVPEKKQGIQPAGVCEFVDIFPTLCDLTGLHTPEWLDGVSLAPAFDKPGQQIREYALSQYPRAGGIMGYSIRTADFRYTQWLDKDFRAFMPYDAKYIVAEEMYDYRNDPFETKNISNDAVYAKTRAELRNKFADCMERERKQCATFARTADYHQPISTRGR